MATDDSTFPAFSFSVIWKRHWWCSEAETERGEQDKLTNSQFIRPIAIASSQTGIRLPEPYGVQCCQRCFEGQIPRPPWTRSTDHNMQAASLGKLDLTEGSTPNRTAGSAARAAKITPPQKWGSWPSKSATEPGRKSRHPSFFIASLASNSEGLETPYKMPGYPLFLTL